ncbi:MAG: metallophosphoesterase [Kiritimatiellae bacterium]|nr:metallophosphoesterase [Kiritimatiellia bacterium]
MLNRRGFIGAAGAFTAVAAQAGTPVARPTGPVRLRLGLLSDIHVTDRRQLPYVEQAFRKLDSWKVDAILACGDLADYGLRQEIQLLAETWFKVFPDGHSATDGRPVVNLLHYGDHDMAVNYVDRPDAKKLVPDDTVRHASLIFNGDMRKVAWEESFKEPWHPIEYKVVKGYPFVLYHFSRGTPDNRSGQNVPGLAEFLEKLTIDPKKPIFFSQHRIPKNTAGGEFAWGQDDGDTTKLFAKYPNLVAFCGHKHLSAVHENAIWQGAFTCVQVPSLRYCATLGGRENSYCISDRPPKPPVQLMGEVHADVHQGMYCEIYDDALVIRRWDFAADAALGPDWVVPLASFAQPPEARPYAFANRAKTVPVAAFPPEAAISVTCARAADRLRVTRDVYEVSFPPAAGTEATPRAQDYEVEVVLRQCDVERVLLTKRVYSPDIYFAESRATNPVVCRFSTEEVPPGWLIAFRARPMTVFGVRGASIETPFEKRVWKAPKQPGKGGATEKKL